MFLDGENDYILFIHPIRLKQCSTPPTCGHGLCKTQSGMKANILFFRTDDNVPPTPAPICPLCANTAEYLPSGLDNEQIDMSFGSCCALEEPSTRGCVVNGEQSCRVTGLEDAVCNPSEVTSNTVCTQDAINDMTMTATLEFQTPEKYTCCHTCSVYGDPRGVSFDGSNDVWILCDGRAPTSANENTCKIKKSLCLQQLDHSNNSCTWIPNNSGKPWEIYKKGSQCVPNPLSPVATLLLYQADKYSFTVLQGERGVITGLKASMGSSKFTLTADDCFDKDGYDAWTFENVNILDLSSYLVMFQEKHDILWVLQDPETKITAKIRCTATLFRGNYGKPRINIEDLAEPEKDYETTRDGLAGFCYSGGMNKKDNTENTDLIESGNGCDPYTVSDQAAIAKLVCSDETIQEGGSVQNCYSTFCSTNYHPNYLSQKACENDVSKDWADGFCKAFHIGVLEIQECKDDINDFGWASAVQKHLIERATDCAATVKELIEGALNECQAGVQLQYQSIKGDDNSWLTKYSILESNPLCGSVVFEGKRYPELFTNPIRWKQCEVAKYCPNALCAPISGILASVKVDGLKPTDAFKASMDNTALTKGKLSASCPNKDFLEIFPETFGIQLKSSRLFPRDQQVVWILARVDTESGVVNVTINQDSDKISVSVPRDFLLSSFRSTVESFCGVGAPIFESVISVTQIQYFAACPEAGFESYISSLEGLEDWSKEFETRTENESFSVIFVATAQQRGLAKEEISESTKAKPYSLLSILIWTYTSIIQVLLQQH